MYYHAGEIFTEQPDPLDLCDLNGETLFLQWKAQYERCDYPKIILQTKNYSLYRYPDDNMRLPIKIKREFNATVKDECISDQTHINVTLSIHLSEYILKHVPYVVCIITKFTEGGGVNESEKLYFQANRNCFSTTTGKQGAHNVTNVLATTADTLEQLQSTVTNYASCNGSFINISYYVLCVFVTTLLVVLEL